MLNKKNLIFIWILFLVILYLASRFNYLSSFSSVELLYILTGFATFLIALMFKKLSDSEKQQKKLAVTLGERIKELNCLYSVSKLLEQDISLEIFLQKTVEIIPQSWQYPEITCARIKFEEKYYTTLNFKESIWSQTQDIKIESKLIGKIEVYYLQEKPCNAEGPFLGEERKLLNALAEKLGRVIQQKQTEKKLKNSEARFKKMIEKSPLPMVITDENQDISVFNEKFTQSFGYTQKDVSTAKEWWEAAYPDEDYRQKVQNSWEKAIEKAEITNSDIEMQEWDFTIKNRTKRSCEFYMVPLNEFSIIIVNDITKRKSDEKELDKYRNHLEVLVKQKTAQLESSLDFLQKTIDGVSDSLMVINLDHTIALSNQAALSTVGKDQADCLTCHQISHASDVPCDGKEHICPIRKVVETKRTEKVEHIHTDDKGHKKIVELVASPIFDEKGEVIQVIELSRDITKRRLRDKVKDVQIKLSEFATDHSKEEVLQKFLDEIEALMESKIGFFHFVDKDQITISLQAWSTNTINTMCTAKAKKAHYSIDKAGVWVDCIRQGKPVIHNDYESLVNKRGLPKGHSPIVRELVVPIYRGEKIVAILGVGNKQSDYSKQDVETVLELASNAWDIIAKKQTEEELLISEERFSKSFQSSPDIMMISKLSDDLIIDVNDAFQNKFGILKENAIGKTTIELDLWADPTQREVVTRPLVEGRKIQDFEILLKRASKEIFDVSLSADIIHIGNEPCIVTQMRDLTLIKQVEKEKKSLETRLQQSQKMESLGTLAGGIAHDFNNILTPIMGYTQLAISEMSDESKAKEELQHVLTASQRAVELVNQILTFSRKADQEFIPLQVQLVVKEALKLLRSSIPTTIEIKKNIANDLNPVLADPTQIHQVMMNLCTNAYHAMKDTGGVLEVSLNQIELASEDIINNSYLNPGVYLKLEISDTGVGIPQEMRDKIFEPYFTTKPKGEGTGLGLAVVHGIITGLNGDIILKNGSGDKTVFQIFLPVHKIKTKTVSSANKDNKPFPTGDENILLVDDDQVVIKIHKKMIDYLGYKVTTSIKSPEALEIFRDKPNDFDLVITDMTMPEMTGSEFSKQILKIRPDIPIMLLTGYSELINPEQAKAIGIQSYLTKPVLHRVLSNSIRKLLDENKK